MLRLLEHVLFRVFLSFASGGGWVHSQLASLNTSKGLEIKMTPFFFFFRIITMVMLFHGKANALNSCRNSSTVLS